MQKRRKRAKALDRSTEGVVDHAPQTQRPAPPGALPDRHTVDSRKRPPMRVTRTRR